MLQVPRQVNHLLLSKRVNDRVNVPACLWANLHFSAVERPRVCVNLCLPPNKHPFFWFLINYTANLSSLSMWTFSTFFNNRPALHTPPRSRHVLYWCKWGLTDDSPSVLIPHLSLSVCVCVCVCVCWTCNC